MKMESKRNACLGFFKNVYGFTGTNDIALDELNRPVKPKPDCITIDLTID